MKRVLANDGIHPTGKQLLEAAGFEVITEKVPQEKLPLVINDYDAIIVRSATKIRKDLIDQMQRIRLICRAGVGLDNIDVDYAQSRGIEVRNTPGASSQSVAELVMGHLLTIARFMHRSNREMAHGDMKQLKKSYSKGKQLAGSTMGIIGLGRIGAAVARMAYGMGMEVLAADPYVKERELSLFGPQGTKLNLITIPMEDVLRRCDALTLHVPASDHPLIGADELALMKDDAILINAARGGVIDENALLQALDNGKLFGVGLDVFAGEPTPDPRLLRHPKISVTPHIGASTVRAQELIGEELARIIIDKLGRD